MPAFVPGSYYRAKAILVVKRHGDAVDNGFRVVKFSLPIARKVDADLMSQAGQRARQSAHNVRQSAGLRIRNALGSHKSDMHQKPREPEIRNARLKL